MTIKERMGKGETVFGTFVKSTDPAVVEILGKVGLDFIIIDNEHIGMSKQTLTNLLRAAELSGVEAIVRVRSRDVQEILQTLDAGAAGIQVPNVDTPEDLKAVSDAVFFSPKGKRGFATTSRAAAYGLFPIDDYVSHVQQDTMIVTHCETVESARQLEKQLSLGITSAVFFGPMDMSQSAGRIGHPEDPAVQEVLRTAMGTCRNCGIPFGTVVGNAEQFLEYRKLGMRYAVLSSDFGFLIQGARHLLDEVRDQ